MTLNYRRIVVKAGTSVLTGGTGRLDRNMITGLVNQLALLRDEGAEILLVSSGAIAAGKEVLASGEHRYDITFRQIMAAVGQNRLMQFYSTLFEDHGVSVAQALLTRNDLRDRQGYLNVRNTLLGLLQHKVVPVINENDVVAVDEIAEVFGDNDTLSALVANLVDADILILLTDTEGLLTEDPRLNPKASLLSHVEKIDSHIESLAGEANNPWSKGGMPSKLEAAKIATRSGTTVAICNGFVPDVVARIAHGASVGTKFTPTTSKIESRKRWMLSGVSARGEINVDNGAAKALIDRNGSLLPPGVSNVSGDFIRGDVVHIADLDGKRIACGLAHYSSGDIVKIKGHSSADIQSILGYDYGQEIVHRDNMVVI